MTQDPGFGYKVVANVSGVKGHCNAGHHVDESFEISCYQSNGLCGFFYHNIFADLQTFQFGGKMPWWEGDCIELQCPDSYNLVTIKLERSNHRV
jgi:uncharacterized repeat protein (TIGR04076 family)